MVRKLAVEHYARFGMWPLSLRLVLLRRRLRKREEVPDWPSPWLWEIPGEIVRRAERERRKAK